MEWPLDDSWVSSDSLAPVHITALQVRQKSSLNYGAAAVAELDAPQPAPVSPLWLEGVVAAHTLKL
ncbi:hypothetical protein SB781_03160 [Paraburkholderia sp. SIMBA_061]